MLNFVLILILAFLSAATCRAHLVLKNSDTSEQIVNEKMKGFFPLPSSMSAHPMVVEDLWVAAKSLRKKCRERVL